jgi:hypothetical protein
MNNIRNQTEKLQQCIELTKQLQNLGFGSHLSGMKEFSNKTNDFIKNDIEFHGKILFEEYPKIRLIVGLNRNKNVDCSVRIKK